MDERVAEAQFPEAHGAWSRQREELDEDSYPSEFEDEDESPAELNHLEQLLSDSE